MLDCYLFLELELLHMSGGTREGYPQLSPKDQNVFDIN